MLIVQAWTSAHSEDAVSWSAPAGQGALRSVRRSKCEFEMTPPLACLNGCAKMADNRIVHEWRALWLQLPTNI